MVYEPLALAMCKGTCSSPSTEFTGAPVSNNYRTSTSLPLLHAEWRDLYMLGSGVGGCPAKIGLAEPFMQPMCDSRLKSSAALVLPAVTGGEEV